MTLKNFTALCLALAMVSPVIAQNATNQSSQGQSGQQSQSGQAGTLGQAGRTGTSAPSGQTGQVGQLSRAGSAGQGGEMDTFIASCLLLGNQEEVALAQVAVQQAESDRVKQFAQMLVDDHQKAIQQLQQHAKPGISLNDSRQASGAGQAGSQQASPQQYTANRPDISRGSASSATMDQVLMLDQQAKQECLQLTKSMLQEKQGAEFDKAFAGMQVGAHVGMLAKLKASEQHASGELAAMIQQSQQTVKHHLEETKQICQELESQNSRQ